MVSFSQFCILILVPSVYSAHPAYRRDSPKASTYAGETRTFQYPPSGETQTAPGADFPGIDVVGFEGPTPTGDEAFAIQTAPAIPAIENESPIVRPDTYDHKDSGSGSGLGSCADRGFDPIRSWGNLSPMFSLPPGTFGLPDASPVVPEGCSIDAVHILHRHGARYPTSGSPPSGFAAKIHAAATGAGFSASGPLAFLNTWTYKLGAEILTPLGRQQLYELGVNTRIRYGDLLKKVRSLPVWRTTSQERMYDSAVQFAAGFFGVQEYPTSYHQLIEVETSQINTTLAPYERCPNANNAIGGFGSVQSAKWISQYAGPIIQRLQPFLDGVTLDASDILAMQELCAYESVALGFSAFCESFSEDDWEAFEYALDLGFWYSNGPGNPTVAAQGVGYVSEFISRLTRTRITNFDTSVNGTIVSSSTLFPFDQPIYVDATHDTVVTAVVVALNLTSLASSGPLPTDHIDRDRQWIISHIAPFAMNLVAQVLTCPDSSSPSSASDASSSSPTHIRWILNDAVVPLTGVKGCMPDKDGLCDLPTYISGTKERIAQIDYQHDCFANYSIPDPDTIVDGRYPTTST